MVKKIANNTSNEPELDCTLCGTSAWQGPSCSVCPYYKRKHYSDGRGEGPADFFIVAGSPSLRGPSNQPAQHAAWSISVEKLIRDQVDRIRNTHYRDDFLNGCYTYAVRCEEDKPKKTGIDCCYPLFEKYLLEHSHPDRPMVILAVGKEVLQSLKISVSKYKEIQGSVLETTIGGRKAYVIPTTSKRQLFAKSGVFAVIERHIVQTLQIAQRVKHGDTSKINARPAHISQNYHYPKTLKELEELTDLIIGYHTDTTTEAEHYIAIDTETNTLNPHRHKLKLVTFIVAWDTGHAMSVAVEHPKSPFTLEEVRPYIQAILKCSKPKVFQNGKYDLKVLARKQFTVRRLGWDTMLGEHLLIEDKAGYYGLKQLTKDYLPEFAGYEDDIKRIQEKYEEKREVDPNIAKLKGAAKKLATDDGYINLPLDALHLYGCIDGDVTLRLYHQQLARMCAEEAKLKIMRDSLRRSTGNSARFCHLFEPACPSPHPLMNLMFTRALPLTKTLADMELHGITVDQEYTLKLAETMDVSLLRLANELDSMIFPGSFPADRPFNPNSSQHLVKVLFSGGYLNRETDKIVSYHGRIPEGDIPKTDKGAISLNAGFLRYLKNQFECPFASTLLDYRAIAKARGTFVENIRVMSIEDERMHTTFHIPGTATGRLSSSGENMQNIPPWIREHNIKKMFIPSKEGYAIINADAKAAEVRIYAAYSKDKNLIAALNEGMDPHSFFASTVYKPETVLAGVPLAEHSTVLSTIGIDENHSWSYDDFQNQAAIATTDPTYAKKLSNLRKNIKRVVFGILYGASERKIGSIVGIPDDQAQAIINVLFKMFPTIKTYISNTHAQVEQLGMVETFLGRRRRFNDYNKMPFGLKSRAKRQAVNFKVQSTSSDIVMDVLCSLANTVRTDFNGQLLITVHDSVVFEVPKTYVSQIPDLITEYGVQRVKEKYPWLPVPFQWDVEVGPSYGELTSVKTYVSNLPAEVSEPLGYEELDVREALKDV